MAIDPQIDSIRAGMGQSISSIMIRAALERHRLPHIVPWYVAGGGLMSYGPDFVDIVRRFRRIGPSRGPTLANSINHADRHGLTIWRSKGSLISQIQQ